MNLYFTSEIRNFVHLFNTPDGSKNVLRLNMQWQRSILNGNTKKLAVVVRVPQTTQNVVISRCCFAEDGKEMYKELQRTCTAIGFLIRPFVWWRSRCRRRGGLLKLPIAKLKASPRFLKIQFHKVEESDLLDVCQEQKRMLKLTD